ncbi:hypothetical protein Tco_0749739 [Tanacetum coccineum]|uniref:Uncharacterized protein n=1 Tax=Tanacetum coccineum TaxID=301880 RepID=A0ABQ4Z2V4_9ASTR
MVKPVWNNAQKVNHQNFAKKTHPCAKKNLVPRAVLMKSGLVSISTARQAEAVNTACYVQNRVSLGKFEVSPDERLAILILTTIKQEQMNYEPIVAGWVKSLKKKNRSRTHKLKRLYKVGLTLGKNPPGNEASLGEDASKQGRINAIDADEEITLVSDSRYAHKEDFDVDALNGEEVFVAGQNENVVEKVVDVVQDNGKGIMIRRTVKPMKKKYQISFDEEVALKLQAEFDEEERLAREKAKKEKEANIALIEEWDDIQAKIDADYQLAEIMQAQEQKALYDAEKATLFQQLLEKRIKHFATKRAEEQRNKPPTQAQQRNNVYLPKEHGSSKKQKVEDDKETLELKKLMEIIPDKEDVAIDAIPLAVKSPRIIYMLVEKKYPLTPPTLSMMLEKKLQNDYDSKMAYHLCNPDGSSYWIKTSQDPMPHAHTCKDIMKAQLLRPSNNNSMSMSVQMSQVQKTTTRSQYDDKRLCLVDDLKEVPVHIQVKPIGTRSSLKSKIIMPYSQDEIKKTNVRAQD